MWEGGSREDWVLALPWSGVSCEFLKKKKRGDMTDFGREGRV